MSGELCWMGANNVAASVVARQTLLAGRRIVSDGPCDYRGHDRFPTTEAAQSLPADPQHLMLLPTATVISGWGRRTGNRSRRSKAKAVRGDTHKL